MNGEKHTEFLEMLRRCSNIMFRVCYMFTDRKPESIKDLYQDIVADAWVGYGSFRNKSAETTWIYRVALNRALQNIRTASGGRAWWRWTTPSMLRCPSRPATRWWSASTSSSTASSLPTKPLSSSTSTIRASAVWPKSTAARKTQ